MPLYILKGPKTTMRTNPLFILLASLACYEMEKSHNEWHISRQSPLLVGTTPFLSSLFNLFIRNLHPSQVQSNPTEEYLDSIFSTLLSICGNHNHDIHYDKLHSLTHWYFLYQKKHIDILFSILIHSIADGCFFYLFLYILMI